MNILDLLVGKPLATTDERAEQIGPGRGIPIFGLDALSSAAYGPEAALSLLIPWDSSGCSTSSPQHCDNRFAADRVLSYRPDHCRLSHGRGLIHGRTLQPGTLPRSTGGCGIG